MVALYPFSPRLGDKYVLTGPDGTRAVFNDLLDPDYVGVLSDVTGLDSPEVRESADELVEADGGVHGNFYYGRRPVVLEGIIYGHSTSTERDLKIQKLRAASNALRADASLTWFPMGTLTNLAVDPGAEVVTSNLETLDPAWLRPAWMVEELTGAIVSTAAQAAVGSRSFAITGPSGTLTIVTSVNSIPFAVKGIGGNSGLTGNYAPISNKSTNFFARADFRSTTARTVRAGLRFFDATGTTISTQRGSNITTTTTGWTTASIDVAVPANAVAAAPFFEVLGNVLGETHYMDSVSYGNGTLQGSQNGDTAGWFWWGTPSFSPSAPYIPLNLSVRRQQRLSITGGWNKTFQLPLVSADAAIQSQWHTTKFATGAAPTVVAVNRGDTPAYPMFLVEGPITNPIISRNDGMQIPNPSNVSIPGTTTGAGARIFVDTKKRTAGVAYPYSDYNQYLDYGTWSYTPVWPLVMPGTNTFQLSGSGTTSATKLTVVFRDAWL